MERDKRPAGTDDLEERDEAENEYGAPAGRRTPGKRTAISRMEQAFGRSFAGVRLRTDRAAAARAATLGARAYSDGDEIGFAAGAFDPDSAEGLHVLAHEAAHIAQRRAPGPARRDPDAVEAEAHLAADAVLAGRVPRVGSAAVSGPLRYTVKSLGRLVAPGKPELHVLWSFQVHLNPADAGAFDSPEEMWRHYFAQVFGVSPARAAELATAWLAQTDFTHVDRAVWVDHGGKERPFEEETTMPHGDTQVTVGGWGEVNPSENLTFYFKWEQHDQVYWWMKQHDPAAAEQFAKEHPEWTPRGTAHDADATCEDPAAVDRHEEAAAEDLPAPFPLFVIGDEMEVSVKHFEQALHFEITYKGPHHVDGPQLLALKSLRLIQRLKDGARPFAIQVLEQVDSTSSAATELDAKVVLDLYGDGTALVELLAQPDTSRESFHRRTHHFRTTVNGRNEDWSFFHVELPDTQDPAAAEAWTSGDVELLGTTFTFSARRFGDADVIHFRIDAPGAESEVVDEFVPFTTGLERVSVNVLSNDGRDLRIDTTNDGVADVHLVHTVLELDESVANAAGQEAKKYRHFFRSFDADGILLHTRSYDVIGPELLIPHEQDERLNPPDLNVEWPASRPPGQSDEPLGALPEAIERSGNILELRVDADGDRSKELLLRLRPDEPKAGMMQRSVRLQVKQLSSDTMQEGTFFLSDAEVAALSPWVTTAADGHSPMTISLFDGGPDLLIHPPEPEGDRRYLIDAAGVELDFHFPPEALRGPLVKDVGEAVGTAGVTSIDVTLGEYGDRFRLTVGRPTDADLEIGLAALGADGAVRHARGDNFWQYASQYKGVKVVQADPRAFALDLDGDDRADMSFFDQLSSPTLGSPAPPSVDRDHVIVVTGPATQWELKWVFMVRDGAFVAGDGADQKTAARAMAVEQLAAQAAEGAGASVALMKLDLQILQARQRAHIAGLISTETYAAWKALSEAMIALTPQVNADDVDGALQDEAREQAQALFDALQADSNGEATLTYVGDPNDANATAYIGQHLPDDIGDGAWEQAFLEFESLEACLDSWIRTRLKDTKGADSDEVQRHDHVHKMEDVLSSMSTRKHLTRIPAVFLPADAIKTEDCDLPQVPLHLYAEAREGWWELTDVTNPHKLWTAEKLVPHDGGDTPPASLMKDPRVKQRFPHGVVRYQLGDEGAELVVGPDESAWATLKQWLGYIGLAAAAVGIIATTGGAGAAVVAKVAFTIAGLAGAAGALADMAHKSEQGELTGTVVALNVAEIVANLATVGYFQVAARATAAVRAGAAASQIAKLNHAKYVFAGVQGAADTAYLVVFGADTWDKLDKIQQGGGSDDDRAAAKTQLILQAIAVGGLTAFSIKGARADMRAAKVLHVADVDGKVVIDTTMPEAPAARLATGPTAAEIRANPDHAIADPAKLPDDVKVYRWAPTDDGLDGASGSSFWQTDKPHPMEANRFLLEATARDLRAVGEVRIDPTAGDGGTGLRVLHREGVARLPGKRHQTLGMLEIGGRAPVFAKNSPFHAPPAGNWRDWDDKVHLAGDAVPDTAGQVETYQMFTIGTPPKPGPALTKFLRDPANWTPARRALHDRLIKKALADARKFADAAAGGEATLYAMRGNTAVGKSRTMANNIDELKKPVAAAGTDGAVNPDNFKPALIEAQPTERLSTEQVHKESSALAARFQAELKGLRTTDGKKVGSLVIDKRLVTVADVQEYLDLARETGRRFKLYDIDAPFEVSLVGVLERDGKSSPLVPFDAVEQGFRLVRANRESVIRKFQQEATDGTYELFAPTSGGAMKSVLKITNGKTEILDADLLADAIADPGDAARVFGARTITAEKLDELKAASPGRAPQLEQALRPWVGKTWKQALDAHSEKPVGNP